MAFAILRWPLGVEFGGSCHLWPIVSGPDVSRGAMPVMVTPREGIPRAGAVKLCRLRTYLRRALCAARCIISAGWEVIRGQRRVAGRRGVFGQGDRE